MKPLMAIDHKYRCKIFAQHCTAITNMTTINNFTVFAGDIGCLQYVLEQYILRKN